MIINLKDLVENEYTFFESKISKNTFMLNSLNSILEYNIIGPSRFMGTPTNEIKNEVRDIFTTIHHRVLSQIKIETNVDDVKKMLAKEIYKKFIYNDLTLGKVIIDHSLPKDLISIVVNEDDIFLYDYEFELYCMLTEQDEDLVNNLYDIISDYKHGDDVVKLHDTLNRKAYQSTKVYLDSKEGLT